MMEARLVGLYWVGVLVTGGLFVVTMSDNNPLLVLLGAPIAALGWPVVACIFLVMALSGQ